MATNDGGIIMAREGEILGMTPGIMEGRSVVVITIRPDPAKLEVLAMNDLGEPSNATPAISDGQIFLRTDGHLYCIAED